MRRALVLATAVALLQAGVAAADPRLALSADGAWRLQAGAGQLRLHDAGGAEVRRWPAAAVLQILPLAARRSFVIAFEQDAELWELQLDPAAEPVFNGLVHDYRLGEGLAEPGFLALRRTRLPEPLRALVAADRSGAWLLARGADQADGRAVLHLLQLDVHRAVARFVVDADPQLDAARAQDCRGRECLLVPDRRGGAALVLDVRAARLQER
jgi:hypothetical protein